MREVDSPALKLVHKALQIAGTPQNAQFDTAILQQVLDVSGLVRRAMSVAPEAFGGVFLGTIRNVHAAASQEVSDVDPYNVGAIANGAYPAEISDRFDVWVLGVQGFILSGAVSIDRADVSLVIPAAQVGWDSAGTPVPLKNILQMWDNTYADGQGNNVLIGGFAEAVRANMRQGPFRPTRVPRGALLRFASDSAGISTYIASLTLGVFPVGMGQDFAE